MTRDVETNDRIPKIRFGTNVTLILVLVAGNQDINEKKKQTKASYKKHIFYLWLIVATLGLFSTTNSKSKTENPYVMRTSKLEFLI